LLIISCVKDKENKILYKKYDKTEYPTYENYDAIEVSLVANIPIDYKGLMGVPVSFMHKYNPKQFEILGQTQQPGRAHTHQLWCRSSQESDLSPDLCSCGYRRSLVGWPSKLLKSRR